MSIKLLRVSLLALAILSAPAMADNREEAVKAMEEYLDFVDYGGATMFAEQIPREDWKRFHVIDARDKDQYAKEHIRATHCRLRQRTNSPRRFCRVESQGGLGCG